MIKETKNYDDEIVEYVFENCDLDIDNYGNYTYDIVDYENLNAEQYGYSKKDFEKAKEFVEKILTQDNLKFYVQRYNEPMIELSDYRTLNDIRVDIISDVYWNIVETYFEKFKEQTGVKIYGLGRSSRHICVENTFENLVRFKELKELQGKLEDKLIDYINNEKWVL